MDKLLGIRVNLGATYLELVNLGANYLELGLICGQISWTSNLGENYVELELIWGQITWN